MFLRYGHVSQGLASGCICCIRHTFHVPVKLAGAQKNSKECNCIPNMSSLEELYGHVQSSLVKWGLGVCGPFLRDRSERLYSAAALCFVEQDLFLLPIRELLKEVGVGAPCPPVEKCPTSAVSPPKPNILQGKERHPQPRLCRLLLGNS